MSEATGRDIVLHSGEDYVLHFLLQDAAIREHGCLFGRVGGWDMRGRGGDEPQPMNCSFSAASTPIAAINVSL